MKKRYIKILAYSLMVFAISCSAPKITVTTIPVNNADSTSGQGIIYYLPQSVCRIGINMLQVTIVPGPYHAFADKFLGIKNVPHEKSTEWILSDMNVTIVEEPDPGQFYLVTAGDDPVDQRLLDPFLTKGIQLFTHREMPFISDYYETMEAARRQEVFYTDLSIKDNVVIETDTLYKTILTDSAYVRVPVYKKSEFNKSIEERAREASDFLIKVRKRRFRLLTGMDGFYPSGDAIRFGTDELDKLEQEYISLFTGKKFTDTLRLQFIRIPSGDKDLENIKLFEYSATGGINARTGSDRIVSLMLKKAGVTEQLENYSKRSAFLPSGVIYYRIPDIAELEIQVDGMAVLRERVPIYQYGTVLALPAE